MSRFRWSFSLRLLLFLFPLTVSPAFSQNHTRLLFDLLPNDGNRFRMLELIVKSQQREQVREQQRAFEEAARRSKELQDRIAELVETSQALQQSLENPQVLRADVPKLAKKCETLSKAIKRLLE